MVTFKPRFKNILISAVILLYTACVVVIGVNQYFLAKTLKSQAVFDTTVMTQNNKLFKQIQEEASKAAVLKVSPTPTPKLIVKSKLTK